MAIETGGAGHLRAGPSLLGALMDAGDDLAVDDATAAAARRRVG